MTAPLVLEETREPNCVDLSIQVDEQHPWFAGHFPQVAIFPGVAMMSWAISEGQRCFGLGQPKGTAGAIKFQALIRPGDKLGLHLEWLPEKQRLRYQYHKPEQPVASGWFEY